MPGGQGHLQVVILAVRRVGRIAQQVAGLGLHAQLAKAHLQVVAVVEEEAAGGLRQVGHGVVAGLFRARAQALRVDPRSHGRALARLRPIHRVQSLGVERVDHHVRAQRPPDHLVLVEFQRARQESRRSQQDRSLAVQLRHGIDEVFERQNDVSRLQPYLLPELVGRGLDQLNRLLARRPRSRGIPAAGRADANAGLAHQQFVDLGVKGGGVQVVGDDVSVIRQ